jgi:hypothetical protein
MLSLPNTHQRLFLEKRDFLVANSVFGYLSLAFPIQKKGEPSSLTKRQKEQSRTRILVPDYELVRKLVKGTRNSLGSIAQLSRCVQ